MTEAADLLGDAREPDGRGMVAGIELRHDLRDPPLELTDELALGAALVGVAEDIERGAAKSLELRQNAHGFEHPRPEAHLAWEAGDRILLGQHGRRHVELVAQV